MQSTRKKTCVLRARDLSLSYGSTEENLIVQGVDFSVSEGEIHSIIGPNGSGKTTLLKGLSGYLPPVEGRVCLNGTPLREISRTQRARKIADLPQDRHAPGSMKVKQLVRKGRYPYRSGWSLESPERDGEKLEQALDMTGIHDLRERRLDTLSGGQRQLAWLAMVLAQDPDVLLLDEPGTHLDVRHALRMLDVLTALRDRKDIAVVTVLHDLNQSIYISDRISLINGGTVQRSGPPEDVIRKDIVSRVFDVEVDILKRNDGFLVFPSRFFETKA